MKQRVIAWGTGNVGRPAIRAIASHQQLQLVAVIVSNPDKDGRDAGDLVGIDPLGIKATRDWHRVLAKIWNTEDVVARRVRLMVSFNPAEMGQAIPFGVKCDLKKNRGVLILLEPMP